MRKPIVQNKKGNGAQGKNGKLWNCREYVLDFLHNNHSRYFTSYEIARSIGYSPRHVNRVLVGLVRETLSGKTNYITWQRVEEDAAVRGEFYLYQSQEMQSMNIRKELYL